MTYSLTTAATRGCGNRKAGGVYGCVGVGDEGIPIWAVLCDPAVPWAGDKFRGVVDAPPEMTEGWSDDAAILIDMVGMEYYPTVPSFVEELRRFGLSRRISDKADWAQYQDKRIVLALIHWRAIPVWKADEPLPGFRYWPCAIEIAREDFGAEAIWNLHYPECLYHTWPLSAQHHKNVDGKCEMPGFTFNPLGVVEQDSVAEAFAAENAGALILGRYKPQAGYEAGIFATIPLTHFEAVGYVPPESTVHEAGLPVVVVEE